MTVADYLWALLIGYGLGSIPTGVWLARWVGIDVLSSGSGNTGATNVARTAGATAGLLTLLGDMTKGVLAVRLSALVSDAAGVAECAALAALLGHSYSIFLRGAGGKAVATAAGAFLVLTPIPAMISIVAFAITAYTTRYASVASLVAAFCLPITTLATRSPITTTVAAALAATFIVFRHRDNLRRLARGTEPTFRRNQRQP